MNNSSQDFKVDLRQRAQRAILLNAAMRWESAVLVALILMGTAGLALAAWLEMFSWLWVWVGLGLGIAAWTAVFISSLTDAQDNARAVAAVLRESCNPRRLRSPKLRVQVDKALEYRDLLVQAVLNARVGILRERLARAIEPADEWIEAIYRLASKLDAYEQDRMIQQDMESVPETLKELQNRLARENNPTMRITMEKTIADKQRQWEQLLRLRETMEKAQLHMESTLAMLGTIYAQLQAIDLQATERGRDEELRMEISEQVHQLQELSAAMDEVYRSRTVQR
ncbi:MAG: hypothetical protein ACUVSF_02675 [Anaerolineae bacterium]